MEQDRDEIYQMTIELCLVTLYLHIKLTLEISRNHSCGNEKMVLGKTISPDRCLVDAAGEVVVKQTYNRLL